MLTDTKVRTAKPRPKPHKIADANRLFLLVAPGGGGTKSVGLLPANIRRASATPKCRLCRGSC